MLIRIDDFFKEGYNVQSWQYYHWIQSSMRMNLELKWKELEKEAKNDEITIYEHCKKKKF